MDLETLKTDLRGASDEEVYAVRIVATNEQERRANLAAIPEQIAAMARTYREGGGDEEVLREALSQEEQDALSSDQFS